MSNLRSLLWLLLFTWLLVTTVSRMVPSKKSCYQEPDVGPCLRAYTLWYFDREKWNCEAHLWGGCGPGGRGFSSYYQCMCECARCSKTS